MGEVLRFRRPGAAERHRGNTLCRRGFHKWLIDKEAEFDVSQGRLVTRYRCQRCGQIRVEAR